MLVCHHRTTRGEHMPWPISSAPPSSCFACTACTACTGTSIARGVGSVASGRRQILPVAAHACGRCAVCLRRQQFNLLCATRRRKAAAVISVVQVCCLDSHDHSSRCACRLRRPELLVLMHVLISEPFSTVLVQSRAAAATLLSVLLLPSYASTRNGKHFPHQQAGNCAAAVSARWLFCVGLCRYDRARPNEDRRLVKGVASCRK